MSSDDRRFVEVVDSQGGAHQITPDFGENCPECGGDMFVPKLGAEPFSILTQGVVTEIYRDYDNDVIARIAFDVPTYLNETMIPAFNQFRAELAQMLKKLGVENEQ